MSYFHYAAFPSYSILTSYLQDLEPQDELIECGQLHGGEYTLFFTSNKKIPQIATTTDFFVTENSAKDWLRAYHKQIHLPLKHGLLLIESTKLSGLFAFLENNPALEAHLLEITRTAIPGGLAQATFVNVDSFDPKSTPSALTATFHAKPNQQLLSLYNF